MRDIALQVWVTGQKLWRAAVGFNASWLEERPEDVESGAFQIY